MRHVVAEDVDPPDGRGLPLVDLPGEVEEVGAVGERPAGLLGLGLMGAGFRARRTRVVYGGVLQGGGIGILYLSFFAAMRLYTLTPPLPISLSPTSQPP